MELWEPAEWGWDKEIINMNALSCKAVYDISALLGEVAVFPGDTPFHREMISMAAAGEDCDLSTLMLSAHAGTHVDAPAHFIIGGKTIDQYPPERFVLPAQVVSVEGKESVSLEDVKNAGTREGEALLFKTDNSQRGLLRRRVFSENFVHLSEEIACNLVDLGISLVGIDYLSVDKYGDDPAPVHRLLLENDILLLEGIDLGKVPPGRYTLICPPIKIQAGEAAPCRAMLVR